MNEFTISRDRAGPLIFSGEVLAHVSSRSGSHQDRWFELTIYRTDKDTYVVHGVGKSTRPGENDRSWAHHSKTAADVISTLERDNLECTECLRPITRGIDNECPDCGSREFAPDGTKYLTHTSREALNAASMHDEKLKTEYAESV